MKVVRFFRIWWFIAINLFLDKLNAEKPIRNLSPRVVRTKYGSLRGIVISLPPPSLSDVEGFLGIPYAAPPTGNLRFMPPGSPSPWRGIKNADTMGPVCPQKLPDITNKTEALKRMNIVRYMQLKRMLPYLRNHSEDCLHLNIYTPSGASKRNFRYPVMVYIHGESYEWNSGNVYDGTVISGFGQVVVVTINFRLGVLGFLNTNEHPHERSIANYGLMDQIAALHWLKGNVAEFGGDPDNVTIFGHGTGAACINFLMTSRAVPPNLFHRAILMSGSSLAPWAEVRSPRSYTRQIAIALNCSEFNLGEELKNCLKGKPLEAIMKAQIEVPEYYSAFGPTVDGVVIDTELDTNPQSYINRLSSVDLMFGLTPAEAFFFFNDQDIKLGLEKSKRDQIVRTFIRNTYNFHLSEIMATAINEYTDWLRAGSRPITTRDETLFLLSDALFAAPMLHTAALYSSVGKSSYFYVFDHIKHVKEDFYNDLKLDRLGSIHGDALSYVWGAPLVENLMYFAGNFSEAEHRLAETILTFWTNFARTGNPNALRHAEKEKTRHDAVLWPKYTESSKKYLAIGVKSKAREHYRSHRLSMWLQLIPQLHQSGQNSPDHHNHFDNHDDWSSYRGLVRSQPFTRVVLPPDTTTIATTTRQYNVSAVLQSTPHPGHASQSFQDDFASYSTALSLTIAIGSSLLILNLVIFAAIYYQRDKSRTEARKVAENGGLLAPAHSISGEITAPSTPGSKGTRVEIVHGGNGKGKTVSTCGSDNSSVASTNAVSPVGQTHLPPPEFADYPQVSRTFGAVTQVTTLNRPSGRSSPFVQGSNLTLSVQRVPVPPPKLPQGQIAEDQPHLHQSTHIIPTSNTCKSPIKETEMGELRV